MLALMLAGAHTVCLTAQELSFGCACGQRLALGVVCRPNRLFRLLWRAVSPFMDPPTRSKIRFIDHVEDCRAVLQDLMPLCDVDECIGGDRVEGYDHEAYSASVLCDEAALANGGAG